VKLEVSKAHEVLPLIQAGIAELYLVPSKWDVLTWENLKMEKDVARVKNNLEEMKSVVEHQPKELKAPFEKMIDDLLSAPQ